MPTTLCLLFTGDYASELIDNANITLKMLDNWNKNNGLNVNVTKSKEFLFRPKNNQSDKTKDLIFRSSKLELVPTFKTFAVCVFFFQRTYCGMSTLITSHQNCPA